MNSFPSPPKPLDSVVTLAQSTSCLRLRTDLVSSHDFEDEGGGRGGVPLPQSPSPAYSSPAHKAVHAAALRCPRGSPHNHIHNNQNLHFLHKGGMSENDFAYSNSRTRAPFRPQKAGKGTTNWQLKQFADATLGSGSLRKAVKLPEGEDKDEWLAVNCTCMLRQSLQGTNKLIASSQASTFTTRSICYMVQSQSSAAHRTALR